LNTLEVWINGTLTCRAGEPSADYISAHVMLLPQSGEAVVDVTGSRPTTEQYHDFTAWGNFSCSVGDEIVIRVVDATEADSPSLAKHGEGSEVTEQVNGPICLFCGTSYIHTTSMFRGKRGFCCAECAHGLSESLRPA
jgi:hypothetical protein